MNIMQLLEQYIVKFMGYLSENGIQLQIIGQTNRLESNVRSAACYISYDKLYDHFTANFLLFFSFSHPCTYDCGRDVLRLAQDQTASRKSNRTLTLALSYGGRDDIVQACRSIAHDIQDKKIEIRDIDEKLFAKLISTGRLGIPDPDLIIRTSGAFRLSNFLLWQAAYAEFENTKCLWPDFTTTALADILCEYSGRKRRFGGLDATEATTNFK